MCEKYGYVERVTVTPGYVTILVVTILVFLSKNIFGGGWRWEVGGGGTVCENALYHILEIFFISL